MFTIYFFLFILGNFFAQNDSSVELQYTDWETGDKVNKTGTVELPIYTDPEGKLTINGWFPEDTKPFKLRMNNNGKCTANNNGLLTMNICAPKGEDCVGGLLLCFVGQLDPANNPKLNKQFQLKNSPDGIHFCNNASFDVTDWKGKVRHDLLIQIMAVKDNVRELSIQASYNNITTYAIPMPDSLQCVTMQFGNTDDSMASWYSVGAMNGTVNTSMVESNLSNGVLLSDLVNDDANTSMYALPLDMMAGVDTMKTDLFAVFRTGEQCRMNITFGGDNLVRCFDKDCKSRYDPDTAHTSVANKPNPVKVAATTRSPKAPNEEE